MEASGLGGLTPPRGLTPRDPLPPEAPRAHPPAPGAVAGPRGSTSPSPVGAPPQREGAMSGNTVLLAALSDDELDARLEAVEARWMALAWECPRGRAWEREDPQGEEALMRAMKEDHEALQAEKTRRAGV